MQIKRSIEVSRWNAKKECANGEGHRYQELNHYLETVRTKVLQIHCQCEQDGKSVTAEILKRRYYREGEALKMQLEVFNDHNKKGRDLLGKEFVLKTVLRYERTIRYLPTSSTGQRSIAQMLGHFDIRTTEIYTKILDYTLSDEM